MKKELITLLISTVLSFVTGCLTYIYTAMETAETFADLGWKAVFLGAVFAGIRLMIKLVLLALPKFIGLLKK